MCYRPVLIKNKFNDITKSHDLVPCRQCYECRQQRAKEWALRCMMEAECHKQGCFITLTYEKSPLLLVKKDLQDFIKRLRKHIEPQKIKYFACGEYGTKHRRPHYHVLVFGYDFADKWYDSDSDSGYPIYKSDLLNKIWSHGLTTVQDITINSAGYCALYASDPKRSLPEYLQSVPEFNTMSQSLGVLKILQRVDKYLETDEIYYDGKKYNIPQCVLNKLYPTKNDRKSSREYLKLKAERLKKMEQSERITLNKLNLSFGDLMEQKKYLKENAIKRLTKNI